MESNYTIAIKTDGTLWAWGFNIVGNLGLGDTANRSSPVQVGALTTWASTACGSNHTLAIKTDGTLWAWGQNNEGQLGLGNTTDRSSPVQVGALTTWYSTAAKSTQNSAISATVTPPEYTQYTGIWTLPQVNAAVEAGTWPA